MSEQNTYYKPSDYDTATHNDADLRLLLAIYEQKRLKNLVGFYDSRIRENQRNSDFTFKLATAIMTVASLLATISAAVTPSPDPNLLDRIISTFPVFSAVLPAFAALLAAFRQLYGWDRQVLIYRDSLLGLERARLHIPDAKRLDGANLEELIPKVVNISENVFAGEAAQWGQFVLAKPEEEGEPVTRSALAGLNLSDDQIAKLVALVEAGSSSGVRISTASRETRVLTAGERDAPEDAHTQPQVTVHETTYTEAEITVPPTPGADEAGPALTETADDTTPEPNSDMAKRDDDPPTSAG